MDADGVRFDGDGEREKERDRKRERREGILL